MTLLGIHENRISKARCDEMPEEDYYIFVYDANDDIKTTKYFSYSEWKLYSPAPLMPSEYLTSNNWKEWKW